MVSHVPVRVLLVLVFAFVATQAIAARGPVDPRVAVDEGVQAKQAGHWADAARHFERAVEASPTWVLARLELAEAMLQLGLDPNQIGQHLAQVGLIDDGNPRYHYLSALLHEQQGRPRQAAAAYEQALSYRPSLVDARVRLGRLLVREDSPAEAVEHFEYAVARRPDDLAARSGLAQAYEKSGAVAEAERALRSIAKRFPANAYHLDRLAAFYDRHRMTTKAQATRKRAQRLSAAVRARKMRPLPRSRR